MANVKSQVTGGRVVSVEANQVADVFEAMGLGGNYTTLVNGSPAEMHDTLRDGDIVIFAQAVKGGC